MTDFSPAARHVLATLYDTLEPLSGRRIAAITGMSPTTVNKELAILFDLSAVTSVRRGRAKYWQTTASAERMLTAEGQRAERTAIVLTALPLEYVAVRDRLPSGNERRSSSGARYLETVLSGRDVRWAVYVFEIGMGNAGTASLVSHAVDEFDADLVIFVGVAAGLKPDDQHHGDVIVAERVYNAHSGKYIRDSNGRSTMLSRPKSHPTAYKLVHLAREIARMPGRGSAETSSRPNVTVGAIASTEAVIADDKSQLFKHILNELSDCVAIDMESFGAYESAYATEALVIAVRGISDFVVDKSRDSDTKWQPVAARNAAEVAADILAYAHPDDVPPSRLRPASSPEPGDDNKSGRLLPPNVRVWEQRLRAASPKLADAAVEELASDSALPVASWISRTLNRPTKWLRADTTGNGWALVGALAEAVEAGTAPRAYAQAARLARENGEPALAVVYQLRAALSSGIPAEDSVRIAAVYDALKEIDLAACTELRPLVNFHITTTQEGIAAVLDTAAPALASLGFNPADIGLGPASPAVGADGGESRTSIVSHKTTPVQVAPLAEEVRMLLAAIVLAAVGITWLTVEEGESAQRAAEAALELVPESPVAQLLRNQAVLTRLHAQSPTLALEDTSVLLRRIEDSALAVRRACQQWGGRTGDALALAGRARIEAGDPVGALRLLQPPPVGQATAEEAKSAEVRRFAAIAALLAGNNELALQLASTLTDDIEAYLVRGAAFARSRGMRDEARMSYLRALELAGDHPRYLERALLGLVRLGSRVDKGSPNDLYHCLQRLNEQDQQAADLVLGNAALAEGDYEKALRLARRYRTAFQAVELETYALLESGNSSEAIERLDSFGRERGDNSIRIQAMMLAMQAGLDEAVDEIADAIIGSQEGELRRMAREAKAESAGRRGLWAEADTQARLLIAELDRSDLQQAAVRESGYRWMRAEALYHRRKFADAMELLTKPAPLAAARREQVLFVFAAAQALVSESPTKLPDAAFDWILALSAAWIKDEEVGAEASKLILLAPAIAGEARLMRARGQIDDYFTDHDNNVSLTRITLPPDPDDPERFDLTPFVEQLKSQFNSQFEPQAEVLRKITPKLLLGHLPGAFLAYIAHRTYTESLIKQALGCYVVCGEPAANAITRLESAHDALQSRRVVADISALVIGGKLGVPRSHLTGLFSQVIFPASLRDDIYSARAALARHSEMTIGWDSAAGRPTVTRYDAETVRKWAKDADELQSELASLSIQPDVRDNDRATWNTALLLAKQIKVPLWADDIALRLLADAEKVPAFGTLDLIDAAAQRGMIEKPSEDGLRAALMAARVVDLPISAPWWECAQREDWDPRGYTALSISRPAAWVDHAASFAQYRDLIRNLVIWSPQDGLIERVGGWAAVGASGSAWATGPGARPKVAGVLLAWTALNTEPMLSPTVIQMHAQSTGQLSETTRPRDAGKMLDMLLKVASTVQASAFPDGDIIHHVVTFIADTIRTLVDGVTAAAIVAQALDALSKEHRARAMTAFLATPAAARPAAP